MVAGTIPAASIGIPSDFPTIDLIFFHRSPGDGCHFSGTRFAVIEIAKARAGEKIATAICPVCINWITRGNFRDPSPFNSNRWFVPTLPAVA